MKKIYIFISGLICISQTGILLAQGVKPCGTTEITESLHQLYPELIQQSIDYNNAITQTLQQKTEKSNKVYIIPIVFHVIHVNGAENIPDQNIFDQVARLNIDYRKLNSDTNLIAPVFQPIAADIQIEFRLAKLDPKGNCTNGIDRIYSHKTFDAGEDSKLNQWPRNKYLNVWVITNIPSSGVGTILAYAHFPADVAGYLYIYDGVIMIASECNGNSRTLTHEIGHWMSLEHPWGSTNEPEKVCGDDLVNDTPITKGHFGSCPPYDSTCSIGTPTPNILENIENYMEYSSCKYMFTQGQRARMRTALESTVSSRDHLWIGSNLAETGTDGSNIQACIPHPEFFANHTEICPGGSVTFTKNILYGTETGLLWKFGDGATSTQQNPTHPYANPGSYDVTLIATNSSGSDTVIKTAYIIVSPGSPQYSGLATEDFENPTSIVSNWTVNNYDNNIHYWGIANKGYNSSHSMMMNSFNNYPHDLDDFISPVFDLSYVKSNATLTFRCAAATKANYVEDLNDVLKIYSSTTCGQTWTSLAALQGIVLNTDGHHIENFEPSSPNEWALQTVSLPAILLSKPNVRFKFEYTTGKASNNVYIDDININGILGINENNLDDANVSIFPNPANQIATVHFHLNKKGNTKIELFDLLGKKVMEVAYNNQTEGDHSFQISKQEYNLNNGVYFIKLSIDTLTLTKKLIITQ